MPNITQTMDTFHYKAIPETLYNISTKHKHSKELIINLWKKLRAKISTVRRNCPALLQKQESIKECVTDYILIGYVFSILDKYKVEWKYLYPKIAFPKLNGFRHFENTWDELGIVFDKFFATNAQANVDKAEIISSYKNDDINNFWNSDEEFEKCIPHPYFDGVIENPDDEGYYRNRGIYLVETDEYDYRVMDEYVRNYDRLGPIAVDEGYCFNRRSWENDCDFTTSEYLWELAERRSIDKHLFSYSDDWTIIIDSENYNIDESDDWDNNELEDWELKYYDNET